MIRAYRLRPFGLILRHLDLLVKTIFAFLVVLFGKFYSFYDLSWIENLRLNWVTSPGAFRLATSRTRCSHIVLFKYLIFDFFLYYDLWLIIMIILDFAFVFINRLLVLFLYFSHRLLCFLHLILILILIVISLLQIFLVFVTWLIELFWLVKAPGDSRLRAVDFALLRQILLHLVFSRIIDIYLLWLPLLNLVVLNQIELFGCPACDLHLVVAVYTVLNGLMHCLISLRLELLAFLS